MYNHDITDSSSNSLHTSQAHTLTGFKNNVAPVNEMEGVSFEAYAYSKAGHNRNTNSDNFYCDSTYMKGFKYVDFKKSADISDRSTVFAVCTGDSTDDDDADEACKKAFEILSEFESRIIEQPKPGAVEARLNEFIDFCDAELYKASLEEKRNYAVHMLITAFIPGYVIYAGLGQVMFIRKHKDKVSEISRTGAYAMGFNRCQRIHASKRLAYSSNDVFVLCSKGIQKMITADSLAQELEEPFANMKETTIKVIEKVTKCGVVDSSTCIAIAAKGKEYVSKMSYIISAVCGVIIALDLAIIIRSFFI